MDFLPDSLNFTVGTVLNVSMRKKFKNWSISYTQRHCYVLAFVYSGTAEYKGKDGHFVARKGDILFFRKGEENYGTTLGEELWTCIAISFDLIFMNEESRTFLEQIPHITRPSLFAEYASHFTECYRHRINMEKGSLLKCRSLISDLLYMLIQEQQFSGCKQPHYDTIASVKNFLIENYTNSYQLNELAAMAELSTSHFRKLFKDYTGETVLQFQNRLKITKACDLLLSGDCNVTEAAYAVGIHDTYYFSRLFKKLTGSSPSQYMHK